MKATGIVRRIDDLGRIVIPKEIRRSVNLREGDAMELYLEDDRIIFQKYEESNVTDYLDKAIDALKEGGEHPEFMQILTTISLSLKNP